MAQQQECAEGTRCWSDHGGCDWFDAWHAMLQGAMGEMLRKHAAGFENWVLTTHEQGYMAAYGAQAEKLVYLTGGVATPLRALSLISLISMVLLSTVHLQQLQQGCPSGEDGT